MIEAEFKQKGNCFSVKLTGHAGAAPKGKDIVCAAVSGIVYALSAMLEKTEDIKIMENVISSGMARIIFSGDKKAEGAYLMAYYGIKFLASAYPEYVREGRDKR